MTNMPYYDVTEVEQTLINQIPPAINSRDLERILKTLTKLYSDEEYQDCLSAMLIIEKYLFRAFELKYFVSDQSNLDYNEYFFNEETHKQIIMDAKAKFNAFQAVEEYQKGVALVKETKNNEAHEYFKRSALMGNPDGAFNYAICLNRGEGCEPNLIESAFWYWVAGCEGNNRAMSNLAYCYRKGIGVCADEMNMLYWYILAGLEGDVMAIKSVASSLLRGIGLPDLQPIGQRIMALLMRQDEISDNLILKTLSSLKENLEPYIYNRNF